MLDADARANIRAIFIHKGEPVAVNEAARLLGWDLDTMDAAIKWGAVKLDNSSPDAPRISRAELLEQALDQWSIADIQSCFTRAEANAVLSPSSQRYQALIVRDRETVRAHVRAVLTETADAAALLRPELKAGARRRIAKRTPPGAVEAPPPAVRRVRVDGVREFTMTALHFAYRDVVPYLRMRGRWLARLGFKPGMRVFVATAPGQLVMSVTDPAEADSASRAVDNVITLPGPAARLLLPSAEAVAAQ